MFTKIPYFAIFLNMNSLKTKKYLYVYEIEKTEIFL